MSEAKRIKSWTWQIRMKYSLKRNLWKSCQLRGINLEIRNRRENVNKRMNKIFFPFAKEGKKLPL